MLVINFYLAVLTEVSTAFQENGTLDEGVVYMRGTMLDEMLVWSVACICITVIGLGLATLKYFRSVLFYIL